MIAIQRVYLLKKPITYYNHYYLSNQSNLAGAWSITLAIKIYSVKMLIDSNIYFKIIQVELNLSL
jgi:hypothetical protein